MDNWKDELNDLDWGPSHVQESLEAVYRHAANRARQAETWYLRRKSSVARVAGVLRLCVVLSLAIGAIGPLVATVWSLKSLPFTSPLSATLFGTLAAAFIAIDRALGFSSRHMRFIAAAFDIQRLLSGFRFGWQAQLVKLEGAAPTTEELHFMLQTATAFEEAVWAVVQNETATGQLEYERSLAALRVQAAEMATKDRKG